MYHISREYKLQKKKEWVVDDNIYDWLVFIGPFELNKWSDNVPFRKDLWDRHFEVWRYYCFHGVSGLGVLFHFRKKFVGFGINWCKGLHGGCDEE